MDPNVLLIITIRIEQRKRSARPCCEHMNTKSEHMRTHSVLCPCQQTSRSLHRLKTWTRTVFKSASGSQMLDSVHCYEASIHFGQSVAAPPV